MNRGFRARARWPWVFCHTHHFSYSYWQELKCSFPASTITLYYFNFSIYLRFYLILFYWLLLVEEQLEPVLWQWGLSDSVQSMALMITTRRSSHFVPSPHHRVSSSWDGDTHTCCQLFTGCCFRVLAGLSREEMVICVFFCLVLPCPTRKCKFLFLSLVSHIEEEVRLCVILHWPHGTNCPITCLRSIMWIRHFTCVIYRPL